jgi:hypothetical protein
MKMSLQVEGVDFQAMNGAGGVDFTTMSVDLEQRSVYSESDVPFYESPMLIASSLFILFILLVVIVIIFKKNIKNCYYALCNNSYKALTVEDVVQY